MQSFLIKFGDRIIVDKAIRRMDRPMSGVPIRTFTLDCGFELTFPLTEEEALGGQGIAIMPAKTGPTGWWSNAS